MSRRFAPAFLLVLLIGCGVEPNESDRAGALSAPLPVVTQAVCDETEVELVVDGGAPQPLAIDCVTRTAGGTIHDLSPGAHIFTLNYYVRFGAGRLLVATASTNAVIRAGETIPVEFDPAGFVYPDADGDGFTNLQEIKSGTDPFSGTSHPDGAPPTAPGVFSARTASTTRIDLSWLAATDDIGVAEYRVYRAGVLLASVTSTATSDSGLAPGTEYCYHVTARDTVGNESAPSATSCATTLAPAAVTAGDAHSCALLIDGTIRCWGANDRGQLGYNHPNGFNPTPAPVGALAGAVAVVAGGQHTCALIDDGSVRCWGDNSRGQLGDGTTDDSTSPVTVAELDNVLTLAAGRAHTCARIGDGTIRCWGANDSGQLGDGSFLDRHSPATVVAISTATVVAAGAEHTCAMLAGGAVTCWGANGSGQLGNDVVPKTNQHLPVAGIKADALAAGGAHTCSLVEDGEVTCWGANGAGQLGDGTTDDSSEPVAVKDVTKAIEIAAGGRHTCAVLADGTMRCWGENESGQLGNESFENSATAVAVSGLAEVEAIATGGSHTCALTTSGAVQCWGENERGQVGDGTTTDRAASQAVAGL